MRDYDLSKLSEKEGMTMDNYYSDKYDLNNYSKSGSRESRTSSSVGSSRPQRNDRFDKEARMRRAERYKKVERAPKPPKVKTSKPPRNAKAKPVRQPAPPKPPRAPKPVKPVKAKTAYRAPRRKKSPAKVAVTVIITILIVGLVAGASWVIGYNIIRENKKKQPFHFSENVKISGIDIGGLSMDEAKKKLVKNRFKAVDDIKLTIEAENKKNTYSKEDFAYIFDYDTPLQQAKLYSLKEQDIYDPPKGSTEPKDEGELKIPKLTLDYKFKKSSAEKVAKNMAKKVDSEPVNAKVTKFHPHTSDKFEYKEGVYGYDMDEKDLASRITKFMRSGKKKENIIATGEQLAPTVSIADLREKIVGLATASTTSFNTANGNVNMATALKACNGSIIEPGETWSFNECTGDSNDPKNGYKKATVITDRKLEEGYGGGVCQASTTIFQAGAFANMGITERHNHFWASGYAFSGEDATIDYPGLDLKLTNYTEYQMFMECGMEGNVLKCNIYGVQEDYYDNVKLYSKNYDITKKKNYSTHTYRVLYLDGKVVDEQVICESFYSLSDKHAVQDEDKGTFRTMVDGTTKTEAEPKKPKSSSG